MRKSHIKVGSWQLAVGSRPMGVSANRQLPTANCFAGFTAVELLTVMIIITLLLAILIPAVAKIRRGAYIANTQNEMDQISSACNRYFDVFNAYPGPVSNSDIESQFQAGSPSTPAASNNVVIYQSIDGQTGKLVTFTGSGQASFFTSSENLVLGLVGGLWIDPNYTPPQLEFVNGPPSSGTIKVTVPNTLIGTGPQALLQSSFVNGSSVTANPSFKQYETYLPVTYPGSPIMMNGDGSPETGQYHDAGGRSFNDCQIPVFTDQFPDHMPILYIRARVGAHGIISGPTTINGGPLVTDPTQNNAVAHYNYDLIELLPYTLNNPATLKGYAGVSPNGGGMVGLPGQHGLQAISSKSPDVEPDYQALQSGSDGNMTSNQWNHNVPTNFAGNAGQYFMNPAAPPTSGVTTNAYDLENATGTPRQKDAYILISAGADRTYGTGDDLTNFGNVGQ